MVCHYGDLFLPEITFVRLEFRSSTIPITETIKEAGVEDKAIKAFWNYIRLKINVYTGIILKKYTEMIG